MKKRTVAKKEAFQVTSVTVSMGHKVSMNYQSKDSSVSITTKLSLGQDVEKALEYGTGMCKKYLQTREMQDIADLVKDK